MKKIISFNIGTYKVGVDFELISEVIKPVKITKVPTLLPYVKGLINNRGKVYTLLDLSFVMYDYEYVSEEIPYFILLSEVAIISNGMPLVVDFDADRFKTDNILKSNFIDGIVLDKDDTPIIMLNEKFITNIKTTDSL